MLLPLLVIFGCVGLSRNATLRPHSGHLGGEAVTNQVCAYSVGASGAYGVCAHLPRHDADFRDKECAAIAALGATTVRFGISWRGMQKSPDAPLDFSKLDAIVAEAESHGLTILPILYWPPKWAQPVYEHLDEYAAFIEAVVEHYGERFPAIELWNEPNLKGFWGEEPDPAKYALVLKAGYEAAKGMRPSGRVSDPTRLKAAFPTVFSGGTAGVPLDYIRKVYEAGGGPFFDALAITAAFGLGKPLGARAVVGMAVVFTGCLLVPLDSFSDFRPLRYVNRDFGCVLLVALGTTGYTLCDSQAQRVMVAAANAAGIAVSKPMVSLSYYFFRDVPLCAALWTAVLCGRETRSEAAELWRRRSWMPLAAGCCSTMTYALVLMAMNFATNVAYVQAFRQIGLVFGLLEGVLILRERCRAPKLAGIAFILVGLAVSVL